MTYIFSSESVSEGHPDKVADQISDAILDAVLTLDRKAKVAAETLVNRDLVILAGEITSSFHVDYTAVVREVIRDIGYNRNEDGFSAQNCAIIINYKEQSPDIAHSLKIKESLDENAGDQGLMFGYACNETASFMPFAIHYAHKLMARLTWVRKNQLLPWLKPDAKTQLTVKYENDQVVSVPTVVLSTQHFESVTQNQIQEALIEEVIKPVIPPQFLTQKVNYLINPSGRFVLGGPMGDCGLTGRKIIVDTYGGYAPHGGGAFSGKDPSKVDRSAAYMARYLAKNIVAAGLAKKCLIQLAYSIGRAEPVSLYVNTFGTSTLPSGRIEKFIEQNFDLKPSAIIKKLQLLEPIYRQTANYGHFGREDCGFAWEKLDSLTKFQSLL